MKQKFLLLVEDEILIAMSTMDSLERYGYDIKLSSNGESAVSTIEENPEIQLILMDIDLGKGIDGTVAAQKILEFKDIPIVFLSSHTEPEIVEKTEKITSYGYIEKNSSITVLDASIKMAFKLFEEKQQRKSYEESIFKKELMLRKIIDTIDYSIFWKDTNGKYIGCNKSFAKSVGLSDSNDIIGKTDYDLPWPKNEADAYLLDDHEVIKANKSKLHIIEPVQKADGSRLIVDTSKHPLVDENAKPFGVLGIYEDITEKTHISEELKKKDNRLSQIASQVPGMLYQFLMKPDGSFSVPYSSNAVKDIFGVNPEDVADDFEPIFNAIHPDDRNKILETISESLNTMEQWKCEYRVQTQGNKTKWIYGNSIPEKNADGSITWSGYNVNITKYIEAEAEIKKQLNEKENLLKEIHHRIKNNISTIESLLKMHIESTSNQETINGLSDAISRVQSMRILYERLLAGNEYEISSTLSYINGLIESVLVLFTKEHNISINTKIDDFNLSSKILFPLGIIFNELMTNIMKHAFKENQSGKIYITLKKENNHVTLNINDNGKGLPEGFDIENASGYGFSLVKILSSQIGGKFSITNSKGTKSTLEFDIE